MTNVDPVAAQLWAWPDPIIKRDLNGAVIFVNAAFLQIYGGQAADWHGCAVQGWPAPVAGPVPNRFETRIPTAAEEQVYDWIESVMHDGMALAMARNVTAILPTTPPSLPTPPEPDGTYDNSHTEQLTQSEPAMQDQFAQAPAQEAVHAQAPAIEEPVQQEAQPAEPMMPHLDVPQIEVPNINVPDITAPASNSLLNAASATTAAALGTAAVATATTQDSISSSLLQEISAPAAPQAPAVETPVSSITESLRNDRKTLPVENEESLLGENWRDAVIAKAVGIEDPATLKDHKDNAEDPVLAAADVADSVPVEQIESAEGNGSIHVLLAEDNSINALLTRTLLEADGCTVDVVEDGSLAVDAMRKNKYDMILMDMRMPNMDGLEATRKIRAMSNAAKSVPIVALTANAFDDDRNACFDAGMNDFMTKPVSAEELQHMVQTWAKKSQAAA